MSEEKDDLKSIKVYKFNNTKENWHEFALKFRVIADTRGYYGVIDGKLTPPDEQEEIIVTTDDKGNVLKEKKDKLKARAANKMGYRDLVMSTDGISLNIVENAISNELPKGDLKKAWERLEDSKQLIVPTRKATKIRARNRKLIKGKNNMAKGTPEAKDI